MKDGLRYERQKWVIDSLCVWQDVRCCHCCLNELGIRAITSDVLGETDICRLQLDFS